ncbi:ABC transporter ATP-binding protein [Holdemania massiliensis]|uniref:ABC transporter ATP-binding protein n=1 Tax=Holdemania massiliensis TaxID=1468449 RepID=UPI001F06E948|nr:ABC transporter ATP-binding protein [Holdemania massiliensis]MCH1942345.1 ABC transporter ATP-binding protein [Holdemania massiliensis]
MLKLCHINKAYPMGESQLPVLKEVSLSVSKGEFITILGASGSGKSTLMHIIGCMDKADSGTYELDGVRIDSCDEDELAVIRNQKIGFIFQKYHLISQYDVLMNVMLPLLIRGQTRASALPEAEETIRKVGLWDRRTHLPKELSGGQQQRAAIARALITKPAVLLADEPTGALDSKTGQEILSLFQQLNEAGNTIIQISHDLNVANAGRRILYLQDGILSS